MGEEGLATKGDERDVGTIWHGRDVRIVLPLLEARGIWAQARTLVLACGRRFAVGTDHLELWSPAATAHNPGALPDDSDPIGVAHVVWNAPTHGEAILERVAWNARKGGSEALVWQALAVLSGTLLRLA